MTDKKTLASTQDKFGSISVIEQGQYRILAFADNDEQTMLDLNALHVPMHSYVQGMLAVLMHTQPKSAIILGLGGGALVQALRQADGATKITAVEMRPMVIDYAKRFFRLPVGKKLTLVENDALAFLTAKDFKKADVLFVDIYNEHGVSEQLLSKQFIHLCHEALKAHGVLVINCWREHQTHQGLYVALEAKFSQVFACLTSAGNWVVFATNSPLSLEVLNNKSHQQQLSNKLGYNLSRILTHFEPWEL